MRGPDELRLVSETRDEVEEEGGRRRCRSLRRRGGGVSSSVTSLLLTQQSSDLHGCDAIDVSDPMMCTNASVVGLFVEEGEEIDVGWVWSLEKKKIERWGLRKSWGSGRGKWIIYSGRAGEGKLEVVVQPCGVVTGERRCARPTALALTLSKGAAAKPRHAHGGRTKLQSFRKRSGWALGWPAGWLALPCFWTSDQPRPDTSSASLRLLLRLRATLTGERCGTARVTCFLPGVT